MRVELIKLYTIEAAHKDAGQGRTDEHLHGHSFRIEIVIEGEVDPVMDWVLDFGDISKAFAPIKKQLDHNYLNAIDGLEDASMPALARWIKVRLQPLLPLLKDVRVIAEENFPFMAVELEPDPVRNLPGRLRFSFSAAQCLPHLPEGHQCRKMHGHTYGVEVGADDLVRLAAHLRSLHAVLDHTNLDEVPGLTSATSERLCAWIWQRLSESVDDLRVVVVQETDTSRCIYYGE